MSDIQDGITQSIMEKFFNLIATAATSTQGLTEFAEWMCSKSDNKKMLDRIEASIKNGDSSPVTAVTALDFSFDDLDKKLTEKGIDHVPFINTDNGVRYFLYLREDEQLVRNAVNELYAEQKRTVEFSSYDFLKMNMGKNVVTIEDLTPQQLKLFREKAVGDNIVFSTSLNSNGLYSICLAENDLAKASVALKKVNALVSGKTGSQLVPQITENVSCIQQARELASGRDCDFYIVSALNPNNYIHVNSSGYEHIMVTNGVPKIVRKEHSKSNDNYISHLNLQAYELSKPVILSPEEFSENDKVRSMKAREKYEERLKCNAVRESIQQEIAKNNLPIFVVSSTDPAHYVEIKNKEQDLATILSSIEKPVALSEYEFKSATMPRDVQEKYSNILKDDDESRRLQQLESNARQLIALKLSLDNDEQLENISSFYNGEVTFHEFFEHELVNEGHSEEEHERIVRLEKEFDAMSEEDKEYVKEYIKEFDELEIKIGSGEEVTEEMVERCESFEQRIDRQFTTTVADKDEKTEEIEER